MATKYTDPLYDSLDAEVTAKLGLPDGLLTAIRTRGERSNADQVSSAGAKTVYQVIPQTRDAVVKKYGIDPYESPQAAAMAAGYLLKESLQRNNGDVTAAVREYHGGTNRKNWGPVNDAYASRVVSGMNPYANIKLPSLGGDGGGGGEPARLTIAQKLTKYNAGKMSGDELAQFESALVAGDIVLPDGKMPKSIAVKQLRAVADQKRQDAIEKKAEADRLTAAAQPPDYTGNRMQQFTDQAGEALSNAGRTIAGDSIVDAATAVPRAIVGGAQALITGGVGMGVDSFAGLTGLLAGAAGAVQGKGFAETAAGQIDYTRQALQPIIPQPVVAPNTANAMLEVLAVPALGTQAAGQANYDAYGNPLAAAALQGLGDTAMAGIGFRGVGKAAAVRPEPAPIPRTEPPAPRPQPAPAEPLPTNPADLAAQAEAMPRPDVAPRPAATGRVELTPDNPDITIRPDGGAARPAGVVNPVLDGTYVSSKTGKPYETAEAAQNGLMLGRLEATHEVSATNGGYKLVPKRNAAPVADPITDAAPTTPQARTPQGKAFTTDNTPVDFVYDVVPVESIQKSLNADMTQNKAARPDLQPRNRDTDASTAQVNEISNNLNPNRLLESPTFDTGAPAILGAEAVAGHGRLTAIERRYMSGRGADYKAAVVAKAQELGIDPAKFEGIDNPVLVRRLPDDATAVKVASDSNASTTLQMSVAEQARTDAKSLPDASKLVIGEDGAVNIAGSTDFVREFMRSMPTAARGDLMRPDGTLSQAGVRRIQSAIAQKAYSDATMLERVSESLDDQGKRISAALVRNAGALVALADDVKAGARVENTLAPDLAMAANKYADIKASGSSVGEYMAQGRLVDDGMTAGALEALQVFGDNARSGKAVSEYIQGKIKEIEDKGNPSQETLFQGNKPASQVIADTIAKQVAETGKFDADYAAAAGELAAAYYKATAAAIGKTSKEVFDAVPLDVKAGEVRDGAKAQISFGEKQHSMVLGPTADASGFIHELGHHFLETHAKLAEDSPVLKADLDAIMEWGGHKGRKFDDLKAAQKTELHEKFAETFEQYLLTGKAPTAKLKAVFDRFKTWMESVYDSLVSFGETNPRAKLSDDIVGVLDNMLGNKADARANAAKEAKRTKKSDAELLDFKRSAPADGGVSPAQHQSRYNVLREIGLTEGQIRGGVVTGDAKRMGWDTLLAKADTEAGRKMKQQMELEADKLREYGDAIVESTGGTLRADPEVRGSAILKPLEEYRDIYKAQIKEYYAAADQKAKATGGIELTGFQTKLRENSFFSRDGMRSLRKGIASWMREQDLVGTDGHFRPMSGKQAESLRQYINSQYDYSIAGGIRVLNDLIDDAVFKTLGENMYADARALNAKYHRIFTDPKGISVLLDSDGINRKVSPEKVGTKLAALAEVDVAQFQHIVDQLEVLAPIKGEKPTALQADAMRAIGEIRAQIAEKITTFDPTKPDSLAGTARAYAPFRGEKLDAIFGKDAAAKLRNYVAARGVLRHVDPNPSGSASSLRNFAMRATETTTSGAGAGAGAFVAGGAGAMIGGVIGQQIGKRLQARIIEAADQKSYDKAMSPTQLQNMRQSMGARGRRLGESQPVQDAVKLSMAGRLKGAAAKAMNARILKSAEWKAYYAGLSDADKAKIKQVGAVVWLSSLGADDQQ